MNRHFRDALLFLGLTLATFNTFMITTPKHYLFWITGISVFIFSFNMLVEFKKSVKYSNYKIFESLKKQVKRFEKKDSLTILGLGVALWGISLNENVLNKGLIKIATLFYIFTAILIIKYGK